MTRTDEAKRDVVPSCPSTPAPLRLVSRWLGRTRLPDAPTAAPVAVTATIARLQAARQRLEASGVSERAVSRVMRVLSGLEGRVLEPPRAAMLGEFNAGKSSLVNLMLGSALMPADLLTNTHLPMRLAYAPRPLIAAVGSDGQRTTVQPHELDTCSIESTERLDIGLPLETLSECTFIDMPGLNDPNQSGVPIEWAASHSHMALWCTPAPQAWKGSELEAWAMLPKRLRSRSLLVVTHADVLHDPNDCAKVAERLRREAGDLFAGIVLLSVTEAARARDDSGGIADPSLWRTSGGEAFMAAYRAVLDRVTAERCEGALRVAYRVAMRAVRHSI
ncbi:MAG TPA: dynamin family protein [Hyphomicrobiaceae bacterium]|nr:dynamin family protein [Hyphomicrobiaceae bacterium]